MDSMPRLQVKKWRALPRYKRLNVPITELGINHKEILKIRRIKDGKTRLLKAAKLQYELYGNIHSYLTAWIAGYMSDVTIRNKFGSTRNLLELFYNTKIINPRINQSWMDIKRKITIPMEITEELAEETGIHIGDGSLYVESYENENWHSYMYSITGNLYNELLYHSEHIQKLLENLYNCTGRLVITEDKGSIETILKSKAVLEFKNKFLGLPIGKKYGISIPRKILEDKNLLKRCIVGIIDTDFTITDNMSIVGNLTCINVMKQMHNALDGFGIKHSLLLRGNIGKIRISKDGSIKIIEKWGLNNQKHITKYELWKKFNIHIPFSRTEERLTVLKGKLDIEDLQNICKNRRPRQDFH